MVNRINEKRKLFTEIFGFVITVPSTNRIGHFYGCYDLQIPISIMKHYGNFSLQYLLFKLFFPGSNFIIWNYLIKRFQNPKNCI